MQTQKYLALYSFGDEKPEILFEPQMNQVSEAIERLTDDELARIEICINDNFLYIRRSKLSRLHIRFSNGLGAVGHLTDMSQNFDAEIEIIDTHLGERRIEPEYLSNTVTRDKAISVAQVYISTGYLPSHGYRWEGELKEFLLK